MTRGGTVAEVDVIRPKVPALMAVFGFPHSNQLSALNDSIRTSTYRPLADLNARVNARSRFLLSGPRTRLRDMVPSVPVAGRAKAAGLRNEMALVVVFTAWLA